MASQELIAPRPSSNRLVGLFLLLAAFCPGLAFAQSSSSKPSEGVDNGDYHYQGSFELGYRFVNNLGSQGVYDTFVNEKQGPRLLSQELNVRSLDHQGMLFDNLFLSSFGWGGDPENAMRMRMSKNKWYDFNASFRRDHNFFDYNDLANPLNPANQYVQVNDSPHLFDTVRRMYDYKLTLLPQSAVRFRLSFTRNNMEGPAFSSVHQGTDTELFQNTRTLLDGYQFGVDVKLLPRTNISYDQFLQYYKGDTSWADQSFIFQLSNGTPVDPGISYNLPAKQPCAAPVSDPTTTPPTMAANCNGYLSYNRWAPVRTSYPTEQITFQSRYFHNLDLSARASYNSSQTDVTNWFENFAGFISRTSGVGSTINGPASAKRIVSNADFGATVHVTEKFRLVDTFRFSNFRIPGVWNLATTDLYAANMLTAPNTYDPTTCTTDTGPTCPQHAAASGADLTQDQRFDFLRQNSKMNTFELEYDFTRRVTGHLGYRYEAREINNNFFDFQSQTYYPTLAARGPCASVTLVNGVCNIPVTDGDNETLDIHAHSMLAGVTARPMDNLRGTFDVEIFSADNAPTRISPRNLQHYKGRMNYKPRPWLDLSGTVNIFESRDNVPTILHREHNRNYGFSTAINPKPKYGFDFGYNYDDVFSTTNICYVTTTTPPVNSTTCGSGGSYFSAISLYTQKIHYGYTNFMFKPQPRVTVNAGYNITSTSGFTPTLADPTILTSLGFNYHRPTAAIDVNLAKGLFWKTAWGYYDYNEKFLPAPLVARDFQSNSATLSLRYDF
ncbi:MAG TPA: hypothetical protein VMH04_07200 [Candidatus Solibacter sp.]|nr:hypothetical protein [Candidatus Solibacter sp.]